MIRPRDQNLTAPDLVNSLGLLTLFELSLPGVIFLPGKAEGEKYSESI